MYGRYGLRFGGFAKRGAIIAATKTDGGGYFVPVEREELMAYVHATLRRSKEHQHLHHSRPQGRS